MSEIKLGKCPLCQGETSIFGYIGDNYCKLNYEEELEVAKHTTIHCYGCDTDFNPHSENAKDVLDIFNTRKPMERIIERLEEERKYSYENFKDEERAWRKGLRTAIKIVKEEGGIE